MGGRVNCCLPLNWSSQQVQSPGKQRAGVARKCGSWVFAKRTTWCDANVDFSCPTERREEKQSPRPRPFGQNSVRTARRWSRFQLLKLHLPCNQNLEQKWGRALFEARCFSFDGEPKGTQPFWYPNLFSNAPSHPLQPHVISAPVLGSRA